MKLINRGYNDIEILFDMDYATDMDTDPTLESGDGNIFSALFGILDITGSVLLVMPAGTAFPALAYPLLQDGVLHGYRFSGVVRDGEIVTSMVIDAVLNNGQIMAECSVKTL